MERQEAPGADEQAGAQSSCRAAVRLPEDGPSRPRVRHERSAAYLEDCFLRESPPRVKELARTLGVSRSLVHRIFAERGTTPSAWLRRERLLEARHLLSDSELKETRVAYKSGYGTRRTFFREFQKNLHMTPSEYRSLAHATGRSGPNVTISSIPKGGKTEV